MHGQNHIKFTCSISFYHEYFLLAWERKACYYQLISSSSFLKGKRISNISSRYERGNNNRCSTLSKLTKYVGHPLHRKIEDPLSLKVVTNSKHLELLANTVLSGRVTALTC